MRVRKQDANGDYTFGQGQSNFWKDVPDGPAQVCMTRLGFWLGQWFLDRSDGTPWETKVLGKYTGSTRDAAIQARILGTMGVNQILSYSSSLNRETRAFTVNAQIATIYGVQTIAGPV